MIVDDDQVATALLTTTDLGTPWTAQQPAQTFTSRAEGIPSLDPTMWCPAATTSAKDLTALAGQSGAIVSFATPKVGHTSHLLQQELWSNKIGRASCRERV